jgi:hypothetical protein
MHHEFENNFVEMKKVPNGLPVSFKSLKHRLRRGFHSYYPALSHRPLSHFIQYRDKLVNFFGLKHPINTAWTKVSIG